MLVEIQCDKFKTGGKDGEVRPPIRFHAGLNAVVGDDDGALFGKELCDAAADALPRTRDERNFSL